MAIEKNIVYLYVKMASAKLQPLFAGINLLIGLLFHFLFKCHVFVAASTTFDPFDVGGNA